MLNNVLNLIQRVEKMISILKNAHFSGKDRHNLSICKRYENS